MATKKVAAKAAAGEKGYDGFDEVERAAMKQRAKELKSEARGGGTKAADDAAAVVAKIAEMEGADRGMAERIHAIVMEAVPEMAPKLWYGMPAYYKDGKSICFFQDAKKFKGRYATLGFNDSAALDDGTMWATSYALTELTPAVEKKIAALVKKAAG